MDRLRSESTVLVVDMQERLAATMLPPAMERLIDKADFALSGELRFACELAEKDPRAVVVRGTELHICVFQTERDLARRGYATGVVADAVNSRREEDRAAGLALCERARLVTTITNAVAFDWVWRARAEAFNPVSKLVC
jgi:nicotinamidase-related amidase